MGLFSFFMHTYQRALKSPGFPSGISVRMKSPAAYGATSKAR